MAESQPQTKEPHTEEPKVESEEVTEELDPAEEHLDEEHDFVGDFQPKDQLDSRLAVVEEQFRKGFDERYGTQNEKKRFWEDEAEMVRTSKVFREVSRYLGYEWQPIFADLMKKFPPEVVEKEKKEIEKQQPIIQGYKALTTWKDLSGPNYTMMQLVDILRNHNMDDIADEVLNILDSADIEQKDDKPKTDEKGKSTKPLQRKKSDVANKPKQGILDNRRLLLLAKKFGADWEPLGKALEVPEEELAEIREGEDSKTYQGAFKVLWSWRQTQPPAETEESRNILKAALEKLGKQSFLEDLEK